MQTAPLKIRLFWFAAIWTASVLALGVVATILKFFILDILSAAH